VDFLKSISNFLSNKNEPIMDFWKKFINDRQKKKEEEQKNLERLQKIREQKRSDSLKKTKLSDSLIIRKDSSSQKIPQINISKNQSPIPDIVEVLSPHTHTLPKKPFTEPKKTEVRKLFTKIKGSYNEKNF
jgi:hypothetical protein